MKIELIRLESCARELMLAAGETPENADSIAAILSQCDARGISTHGTYLLNPIFDRVRKHQFQLPTEIRTVKDEGAVAILDGMDGLGQVAFTKAAKLAAQKAEAHGIATVFVRNTNNAGALATYTEQVSARGMMAYLCCNASPAMAPWGGMDPFIGTQPFAFSIHTGQDIPFSADMSTSIAARGKIRKAARSGQPIPEGWALDPDGNPTTDPALAVKGTVLPIGGAKGSAIGLMIDIMAGILSGASHAPDVKPIHTPSGKAGVGGFLFALNIRHFCDMGQFEAEMAAYIAQIKGSRKAKGFDEILLPGEGKLRKEHKSRTEGVEMDENAVGALNALLAEIGSESRLAEFAGDSYYAPSCRGN